MAKESKQDWYIKLARRLEQIKAGELSLDEYIVEVNGKINKLSGPARKKPFYKKWNWNGFLFILALSLFCFMGRGIIESNYNLTGILALYALIRGIVVGIPLGLMFAWMAGKN